MESDASPKPSSRIGALLRLLASGGMADEDPSVVHELLTDASRLAHLALNDEGASLELHQAARAFLGALQADTFETYE